MLPIYSYMEIITTFRKKVTCRSVRSSSIPLFVFSLLPLYLNLLPTLKLDFHDSFLTMHSRYHSSFPLFPPLFLPFVFLYFARMMIP
ncbi:MAG: hypothetical protein NXY57DRAFT_430021 [Lentinula lateritia]|nr:MAG: hypothetical protein NXY57DRAFT_430021 [Lentinula lateritia]